MRIQTKARLRDPRLEDQIREIQRRGEETPLHAELHKKGGKDELRPQDIGAETPTGAQQKANQAAEKVSQEVNANLLQHTSDANPHDGSQAIQGGVERPTAPKQYEMFFDEVLNKPVWWNGSVWVDATGSPA